MDAVEARTLSEKMMKRQLALSIKVASVFVVIIVGLPMLNWLAPSFTSTRVAGFSLSWLILGLLFYPITWILSAWFVKKSETIEAELTQENRP